MTEHEQSGAVKRGPLRIIRYPLSGWAWGFYVNCFGWAVWLGPVGLVRVTR